MNLHAIAGPIIATVNPFLPVTLEINIGQSQPTGAGKVTPIYAPPVVVSAQIQPLTWRDLQMIDGINLGGIRWKVYLTGEVNGVVRAERKGGDKITVTAGRHQGEWLVVEVLEQFQDWVCAAIVLQNSTQTSSGLTTDLTNTDNNVVVPAILTGV